MVTRKPDISDLVREFPHLADAPACSHSSEPEDRRWYQFAELVRELSRRNDNRSVQAAFDRLEELLAGENSHLRGWVTGFLQALHEVTSWSSQDVEPFLRFMGERTRHVWATLDTIRLDLADCSILEAEVLM